ncbi:hypothetical protein ERO13_A13G150700v2 [Gossypium hirsutum]|uniref:F-box protein At5g55150 n=1 Tax=Gossypium hirsutum TaxID=3635 RepID=A0ABM2ZF54_GOSHI|nr:putative F-box protein At5g55150 [Gossypium hirsutum]KAG4166720.1 hypothetical protein ERO13_A13G150700v2 [Gossypium hirsutum]
MGNSMPDWEYLPKLCLLTVFEKIDEPISLVQFGAVSKYWHSLFNTFLDIKRRSSTNLVPMLMIPFKKSATKRKIYSLQAKSKIAEIEFPKPYTWRYCGSCYGWLATVDESFNITLSNPFENLSIRLPQFDSMAYDSGHYTYKILKVVLSEDPLLHPNNFVVVVIYSVYGRLAFYRPCQENWIYMDVDEDQSLFLDILFHKGLVYAIGHYNNLVWFDVNGVEDDESSKPPKLNTLVPTILRLENYSHRAYLVRSSMGNLYSIHKHLKFEEVGERSVHSIKKFTVFKLILDDENSRLLEKKEVQSIDGDIVFVGDNRTLAVSALDFPEGQPNSIYFTDDFIDTDTYEPFGPRDIGIFHLKDGSLEKYYQFKSSHKDLPPYIWISPSIEYN